jgi:hypothetical protein
MLTATITATPEAAREIWDSLGQPTDALVAQHLSRMGVPISARRVARWRLKGWREAALARQADDFRQVEKRDTGHLDEHKGSSPELGSLSINQMITSVLRDTCSIQINVSRGIRRNLDHLLQHPDELTKLMDQVPHTLAALNELLDRVQTMEAAAELKRVEQKHRDSMPRTVEEWAAFGREEDDD